MEEDYGCSIMEKRESFKADTDKRKRAENKQYRPKWCPHDDCEFKIHSQNMMCCGTLPLPEVHDNDFNTYRLCLDTRETGHGIFDLQVNKTDLWNLKRIIKQL